MDDTPDKNEDPERDVSDVIDEDTARGTKRRPYKGRHESLVDEFLDCVKSDDLQRMLRVLRAEGYPAKTIAAFAAKWREQRGGGGGSRRGR